MPTAWFENSLANSGLVLVAILIVLCVARRMLLGAATDRDQAGDVRRPGPPSLPRPKICVNPDCEAPNRPDAIFCRRCGTKLPA